MNSDQTRAIESILWNAGMAGFSPSVWESAAGVVLRGSLSDVAFRVTLSYLPGTESPLSWVVASFNKGAQQRADQSWLGAVAAHAYAEELSLISGSEPPPQIGEQADHVPPVPDRDCQLDFVAGVISAAAVGGLELNEPTFYESARRCLLSLTSDGVEVTISFRYEASLAYTKSQVEACWNQSKAIKAAADAGSTVSTAGVGSLRTLGGV